MRLLQTQQPHAVHATASPDVAPHTADVFTATENLMQGDQPRTSPNRESTRAAQFFIIKSRPYPRTSNPRNTWHASCHIWSRDGRVPMPHAAEVIPSFGEQLVKIDRKTIAPIVLLTLSVAAT